MSVNVGKMRIGEVHSLLRQDYPNIELSKIRYYEDKGLVMPGRSRKGYRLYSERDVACLREAIRLAQEEFVPLRVVRVRLIEQGLLADTPTSPAVRQVARETTANVVSIPAPTQAPTQASTDDPASRPTLTVVPPEAPAPDVPTTASDPSHYWTMSQFLTTTGLELAVINQLQSLGLLAPVRQAREIVFTARDVRVAGAVGVLLTRGVDARLLGSLRRIVEREVSVVDDLTQPLRAPGSQVSIDQAHDVAAAVATEVAALRAILLERALEEYLGR